MGEVWGFAANPRKAEFVTAGDDMKVIVWDAETHSQIRSKEMTCSIRAVCYNPDGSLIVAGCGGGGLGSRAEEGSFIVLDANDLSEVYKNKFAGSWIQKVSETPRMKNRSIRM